MSFWEKYKTQILWGAGVVLALNVVLFGVFWVVIPHLKNQFKQELLQQFGPTPFIPKLRSEASTEEHPFVIYPHHPDYKATTEKISEGSYGQSEGSRQITRIPQQNYGTWATTWERERLAR